MTDRNRLRCILPGLTAIAIGVFLTGISWGLPSRAADPYLFGSVRPWTGAEILRLAGDRAHDETRGADVAVHRIEDRSQTVLLNETDRQRAEIVRRYRLYTYQPDEMLTLMSLASMKPAQGDLDPKLYQYGGLFIYPAGAALKIASKLGLVELKSDTGYYLDRPETFGRFYIVIRGMVAAWGVVGAWAVFWLIRRLAGGLMIPAFGALGFVFMPVVVNMSHEAKPHLPGAVLMLLTVLAAERYVQSGKARWAIAAGAIAGAAVGMVISSLLVFFVLPVMTMLRKDAPWKQRFRMTIAACSVGILVYLLTNPYVAINLVRNRAVLQSNLGNSTQMYSMGGWSGGVPNAMRLSAEGASPGIAVVGIGAVGIMAIAAARRASRGATLATNDAATERKPKSALLLLLAAPATAQAIQFMALAAGKPGEYGRFALFLDVTLLIAAVATIARVVRHPKLAATCVAILVAGSVIFGMRYVVGFVHDCRPVTSRLAAAEEIRQRIDAGARSIAIWAEPAPYSLPPVDLFRCRLLLLPRATHLKLGDALADMIILPADAPVAPVDAPAALLAEATAPARAPARRVISWADRSF